MSGIIPGRASGGNTLAFGYFNPFGGGLQATRENQNITSFTNPSTGLYSINVTAAGFTLIPIIFVMTNAGPPDGVLMYQNSGGQTATVVTFQLVTTAGVPVDLAFNFLAVGV